MNISPLGIGLALAVVVGTSFYAAYWRRRFASLWPEFTRLEQQLCAATTELEKPVQFDEAIRDKLASHLKHANGLLEHPKDRQQLATQLLTIISTHLARDRFLREPTPAGILRAEGDSLDEAAARFDHERGQEQ